MPLYSWHDQVETSRGILVDKKLAPLLEALWDCDLPTQFSCQGGGEDPDSKVWVDPYIVFPTYDMACGFLRESSMMLLVDQILLPPYIEQMWLHPTPPHPQLGSVLRGKVSWRHQMTKELTKLWQVGSSVSYTESECEVS